MVGGIHVWWGACMGVCAWHGMCMGECVPHPPGRYYSYGIWSMILLECILANHAFTSDFHTMRSSQIIGTDTFDIQF